MLSAYSPSDNSFRIADVTGDGVEDLIVDFIDTYTAAMHAKIFTYDAGKNQTVEADIIGVDAKLYTGGVIEVPALHNQTYGSMWPMTIYKFENGKFTAVAGYHSREEANDRKNFPYDADKEGDGIVYYFETSDG